MKISQIIYTGFGGLGSVAFSLVEADRSRDHKWSIGFIGDVPLDEDYPPKCRETGADFAAFQSKSGRPYAAWFQLWRWLHRTKPDAVLLHSINSILPTFAYCLLNGRCLIAVEHTPNAVKTRNERVFSKLAMRLAHKVVLLTPEYEPELKEIQGSAFNKDKVSIIANGIDTHRFRPRSEQGTDRSQALRLGMAARFSYTKRQDLLVEMMALAKQTKGSDNWVLSLAGNGDEFERVRRLAVSLGVADRIEFVGLLNENELADWFRTIDVYLHASDGETLSTSLLQAMASGLPIVASGIPGISNLLEQNDHTIGLLANNDPQHFFEVIVNLVASDRRRVELAGLAREICLERYSNQVMLERYVAAIHAT